MNVKGLRESRKLVSGEEDGGGAGVMTSFEGSTRAPRVLVQTGPSGCVQG